MEFVAIKLFFGAVFGGIGKAISAAFTFLTTKPGVYLLIAGLAVGAYWYSGHEGYKRAQDDDKASYALAQSNAVAAAEKKARLAQADLDKGMAGDAYRAGVAKGKSQAKTIYLKGKIAEHVTPEIDRLYPVPCGLYRMLRAADEARDLDPATISLPAGLVDGDSCPITASDLADHGVAIAGIAHDLQTQVIGLQDLARTLKAAAEK